MSNPTTPDDGSNFNSQLSELLRQAHENGADVEGAWKCTIDGNGHSHWDVQITRVKYDEDEDHDAEQHEDE